MVRPQEISGTTRFCAVYGHPVKHSASPAMHNAAIETMGLDWRYLAFDVHPEALPEALNGAGRMGFIGLNLTVPHKLLAVKLVDELDESAQTWGAVNTVLFEGQTDNGTWEPLRCLDPEKIHTIRTRGFNTDADAIVRSIEEDLKMRLQNATVLLLGAGGAGRTAALKLASAGVKALFLVNRTVSKAEEIASEIRARWPQVALECVYPQGLVDLVINATSLGLKPDDALPFERERFRLNQARAAYDMIYRPAKTRFLQVAAEAGCQTANGLGMLLYQGAKALEIWSGRDVPIEIMRNALRKHIYGNE